MGSTDEQPASELVADLLDTARASRTRTMQEVTGAWQRAGTITRNLILMASSETGSIERPATDLVTQLHTYILVADPEAATSRPQPPSPLGFSASTTGTRDLSRATSAPATRLASAIQR